VTVWPGGNGWPSPRRRTGAVEVPVWVDRFVPEDWVEPGDDEVRYPAGAPMPPEEVARRRWLEACREWAAEHGVSIADRIAARHWARRRAMGWDDR
jgi:hypothetical protein